MLLKEIFTLACIGISLTGFGQSNSRKNDFIDATVAFASNQNSLAVHYTHMWRPGKSERLSLGLGGHITTYLGANQYYITAPAQLTSESTSPLIFFKDNIEKNIDSLFVKSPQATMVNVSINIHYRICGKIAAGFSIDALGFSFGARQAAHYINGSIGKDTQAGLTPFNILLISDNDRGSLNSEIFLRYNMDEKWSIKGGLQFLFTEYKTDTKVQQYPSDNDRFRVKSFMIEVGIGYKIK